MNEKRSSSMQNQWEMNDTDEDQVLSMIFCLKDFFLKRLFSLDSFFFSYLTVHSLTHSFIHLSIDQVQLTSIIRGQNSFFYLFCYPTTNVSQSTCIDCFCSMVIESDRLKWRWWCKERKRSTIIDSLILSDDISFTFWSSPFWQITCQLAIDHSKSNCLDTNPFIMPAKSFRWQIICIWYYFSVASSCIRQWTC